MILTDLLKEIESLRSNLNELNASGSDYNEILKVSQQLDVLIVMYYKAAA